MVRLTTPVHTFDLPQSNDEYKDILVSYSQCGNVVLRKHKAELACDGPVVGIHMTQAETALFRAGHEVTVQVRCLRNDGEVITSDTDTFRVEDVIDDEALYDGVPYDGSPYDDSPYDDFLYDDFLLDEVPYNGG